MKRMGGKSSVFVLTAVTLLFAKGSPGAVVLSNNLANVTAYTDVAAGDDWLASEFGTDASVYRLDTATVLMSASLGSVPELDLYSSVAGQPGFLIGVLTAPLSYSVSLAPTAFGGAGLLLSPNSSYWLVLKGKTSDDLEWAYTDSTAGSGVGFTHTWGASSDAGASWYASDLEPYQFSVTGDPQSTTTPEPATFGMAAGFLMAASLLRRVRLKKRS